MSEGSNARLGTTRTVPTVRVETEHPCQSPGASGGSVVWREVATPQPEVVTGDGDSVGVNRGSPVLPMSHIRGGNATLRQKLKPLLLSQRSQPPQHPQQQQLLQPNNEISSNGEAQSIDNKTEKSELLSSAASSPGRTPQRQGSGGSGGSSSRWAKLRTTVKMAGAVNQTRKKRKQSTLVRQDSFLKRFSTRHGGTSTNFETDSDNDDVDLAKKEKAWKPNVKRFVIHPDENFMFYWMALVTMAVLYNLWTCIAREAFPDIGDGYEVVWFTTDAICDTIYLSDILVQLRTGYLERGLIVYDSKKLAQHYTRSRHFIIDLVALSPLDLIQPVIGIHPLIRFPRFLKSYRAYRFIYMVETRTGYPNMWRVANLSHLLFLGSHWFAAFYFMISKAGNFKGTWGYPKPEGPFASVARKYLKSLYWSTLTLTTIGDLPPPESNYEWLRNMPEYWYVFTIVSYLIGVFVFATIVGQVGNVITNRNASRQEFERLLDGAKAYMRNHNVPQKMQRRVQRWYDYAWSRGRMNGGGDINSLGLLPDKLKTELALHVNLETLKKVTIFQECEPEFLHDLVLKMKAFIFTPGDLICRKGEVAREMFIIADGLLEVISDSGEVLTQMSAGDFFGEIGILNLDGGVNRRTADVKSVGYSELFVLSREDVLSALKDHPEAEGLIKQYGHKRLRELGAHNRKKMQEKLARRAASAENSPVHMLVTSADLLSKVINIRHKHSHSADEIFGSEANVISNHLQNETNCADLSVALSCDRKCVDLEVDRVGAKRRGSEGAGTGDDSGGGSFLQRVLQLGREQSKLKEEAQRKVSLGGQEGRGQAQGQNADQSSAASKTAANLRDILLLKGKVNDAQTTQENKKTAEFKSPRRWGLLKAVSANGAPANKKHSTTLNQGKHYKALSTEEKDQDQPDLEQRSKVTRSRSLNLPSPDQITITVETDESDLDSPDKSPTKLLESISLNGSSSRKPDFFIGSGSDCDNRDCGGDLVTAWVGGKTVKFTDGVNRRHSDSGTITSPLRKLKLLTPILKKPNHATKAVSFENPLFDGSSELLRDCSLKRPKSLPSVQPSGDAKLILHDLGGNQGREPSRFIRSVGLISRRQPSKGQDGSRVKREEVKIEMQRLGNGDIPNKANDPDFSEAADGKTPLLSKIRRRPSMGTEESLLSLSEESLHDHNEQNDVAANASVSSLATSQGFSSSHSPDTWGSETTERNGSISSSLSVGSVLSRQISGSAHTDNSEKTLEHEARQSPSIVESIATTSAKSPDSEAGAYTNRAMTDMPCMQLSSDLDFDLDLPTMQSSVDALSAGNTAEKPDRTLPETSQSGNAQLVQGGTLLKTVTSMLQEKLNEYERHYEKRIKELEAENRLKQQHITSLEQQLRKLQVSLDMEPTVVHSPKSHPSLPESHC